MFFNFTKVAKMGVTNVIVTNFDGVFRFVVLTENNYCFLWQILLLVCGRCYCHFLIVFLIGWCYCQWFVADVVANDFCGWCYCHMWLMSLPLIDCYYVGWCYCQWLMFLPYVADGIATFYVMGWCYCPVADGIAT